MNGVSLFAGVGGFDLAMERAGVRVVAAVEIDKACRKVLAHHFPDTRLYEDVSKVHAYQPDRPCEECLPDGRVDVVCGGFPCQDLSVAGRRAGLAGLRSGLFYELARIVSELRPRWVVLENVPGLLSSNDGRDMAAVVGTMGDLGYGWAYRVLDAQHFGVPQRRRRVFVVGCLGDRAAPVEVLLEPEGGCGDSAAGVQAWPRVAPTLESGAHRTCGTRPPCPTAVDTNESLLVTAVALRGRDGGATAELGDDLAFALRASQGGGDKPHVLTHALTAEGADASEDGTGRGTPLTVMSVREDQRTGQVYEMPYTSALAQAGGKPGQGYQAARIGDTVRRLTPMECERLQGFPDGWTAVAGQADSPRYRQMGNAVAVPVVEWILQRVVAVDAAKAPEVAA